MKRFFYEILLPVYIPELIFFPQDLPDLLQQDFVHWLFFLFLPLSAKLTPDTNNAAVANRNIFFIYIVLEIEIKRNKKYNQKCNVKFNTSIKQG